MSQDHWQSSEAGVEFTTNEGMEYDQMEDVGEDISTNAQVKRKLRPWEKVGPDGKPIKRTGPKNTAKKHMMLRKAVQPKNAVMCLHELNPGVKFTAEPVTNVGNFMVTVEVNGASFVGYGTSKDQAKQAAAEAALMSFVKPPPPKPPVGQAPKPEEDGTPWRTLAAFAMFKLFNEWRDKKGASAQAFATQMGTMMPGYNMMFPAFQTMGVAKSEDTELKAVANISAHLNKTPPQAAAETKTVHMRISDGDADSKKDVKVAPKPVETFEGGVTPEDEDNKPKNKRIRMSKLNPEVQATMHPVMVLHQMCPQVQYHNEERTDGVKGFIVTAVIDGQNFAGEGTSVKKAKFVLAKTALKELYSIDNTYALSA